MKKSLFLPLPPRFLLYANNLNLMAMHYRGHNNAAGGRAANPFTGRSLPANGARGRDYHGNSPSLVPGMIKKAAFLVLAFVVFFYVYDDEPYESNLSLSVQKKESSGEAVTKSYTNLDLASKPQSEPVQLKLPGDVTLDPDNNEFDTSRFEVEGEGEMENTDYEYQRAKDEDEEDEMRYEISDPDEQSYESAGEGNDYASAEKDEEVSAADQIIDSNMQLDEYQDGSEDRSQGDSFLGLSDPKEEEGEVSTLDVSHGGLRGSNSANSENPFGRQEETHDNEEKDEKYAGQVVGSSEDNGGDGTETLYNNSPLEVPNSVVADDPAHSKPSKSMRDEIGQISDNTTVAKSCEDDPDFRYKGNEEHGCEYVAERQKCDKLHSGEKVGVVSCPVVCDMVDACLTRLNEQELSHGTIMKNDTIAVDSAKPIDGEDTSEEFINKEEDAFEAKYGIGHKSMEDELGNNDALGSDEVEKQSPSIAVETADNILKYNQTEAEQSEKLHNDGLSTAEGVGNQTKSMANELESEKGDNIYDIGTKLIEFEALGDDTKSVRNETDKAQMMSNKEQVKGEHHDDSKVDSQDSVILESDANVDVDSLVNKTVSLVESNFKEYLITNSEDEPSKDEMEADDRSKHDEDTLVINDNHTSNKIDEDEELVPDEQQEAKDTHESLKKSVGGEDAPEPDLNKKGDYKAKKSSSLRGSVDKISINDSLEIEKDSKLDQDEESDIESLAAVADYKDKQSEKMMKTDGKTKFKFESQGDNSAEEFSGLKEELISTDEKNADGDEEKLYGDESKNILEQGEENVEVTKYLDHNDDNEDKPKKKDSNDALEDEQDGEKDPKAVKKEEKEKAKIEKESKKTKGKGKSNVDLEDLEVIKDADKQKKNEDSNDVAEKDHDAGGDSKAVKKEKKDKTDAGKTKFKFESQDDNSAEEFSGLKEELISTDEKNADGDEEKLYGDESKNILEQGEENVEVTKYLDHNDDNEDKPKKKDSNDALEDEQDGEKDPKAVKKEEKEKAKIEKESKKTKGKGKSNVDLEDLEVIKDADKQKKNEDSNDVAEKDHDAGGDSKAVKKEKKDKTKKKNEAGRDKKKAKSKRNDDSSEALSNPKEGLSIAVGKMSADTNEIMKADSEALEQGNNNDKDINAEVEMKQDIAFPETSSEVKSVEDGDSSNESDNIGEESKVRSNSTDSLQFESLDGDRKVVSNNENNTASHIHGIEEHAVVNNETKGSGDEGEVQDATEDSKVEENPTKSDVEVSMDKNGVENDTEQKASGDNNSNVNENAESQEKGAGSISQDADEKAVNEVVGASSEVYQDLAKSGNFEEEVKYAKIASQSKESDTKGGNSGDKDAKDAVTAKEVKDTKVNHDVMNSGDENDQGEKTTDDAEKEKDIIATEDKTEEDAQTKEG